VYAAAKGVALAGMCAYAQLIAPGVAFNALLLTLSTAGSLLFALKTNMIQVRLGGRAGPRAGRGRAEGFARRVGAKLRAVAGGCGRLRAAAGGSRQ
jgi:hypothetical protein